MHQFLLGASFPFTIGLIVYAARRFRAGFAWLVITPLLTAICGVWAIIPDIPRLVGWSSLYMRMARDPATDIFFWHYTIDLAERESAWYQVGLVVIPMVFLLIAWREVARLENGRISA